MKAQSKKAVAAADLTVKERIARFEALVKEAIDATQIGLQIGITGPWANVPEIKGNLSYIDLIELKQKQDEQAKAAK